MDHEVGPWKMVFFHGPTIWSNFHGLVSLKNILQSPLGPLVGVNGMWIKRNNHASRKKCAIFFYKKYVKSVQFKKYFKLTFLLSSLVFIFSSPKKLSQQYVSAMGPCFFILQHLFCLSHHKNVGACQ